MVVIGRKQYYSTDPDSYAIFAVTGLTKQGPDKTYWKLTLTVEQSRTNQEVDLQVSNNYIFYEYDKKIHTIPESQTMTRMLSKSEILRSNLKNLYDDNSGLYFV
jgi:tRNA U54 and U55 pseudouridine synthase Pus10